jgi:hypothetical protein
MCELDVCQPRLARIAALGVGIRCNLKSPMKRQKVGFLNLRTCDDSIVQPEEVPLYLASRPGTVSR